MSAQYFIATLADGQGYALLDGNTVISTHETITEAVKARDEQSKSREPKFHRTLRTGPRQNPRACRN